MSLDKEAIEKIESMALAATPFLAGDCGLQTPVKVLPNDVKIQSLEGFLAGRTRFRGTFKTQTISDFALYAGRFPGGSCFVSQQLPQASLILNLGDAGNPGHADHTANLQLSVTAPFSALCQFEGTKLTQKQLAEWLEDWRDYLIGFDSDGMSIEIRKAVAAIRRFTIAASSETTHSDSDFGKSRSALEQVEAKSENGLPSGFRFTCVPYHGLDLRSFEVRLSIITEEKPKLVLRHVRFEESKELIAQEFAAKVDTALKSAGAEADIYIGAFEK